MLGISATVERKDGMTKVLNMFIGPKIYSEEREQTDPVCVRAVEYVSADPEFNEVEYDFRGKPKHSTMLSKLSNYVPRSEFIVRIIADLVKEHPENQIMILGHQRALLTYFYEAIRGLGIAGGSVGYYIGGMKEESLKTTETMRIVLATYAMAAEALDIKSLATLVMVSPKTDIVQSVGRILRVQHEHPIIVDVVDKHDLFQNQWAQRRRYYKKCGYRVRQIDSLRYSGMSLDWKTDRTWRWVHEPVNLPGEKETGHDSGDEVAMPRKCLLDTSSIDFDSLEY
jgi:superfamily II DNA or RNA helicase